MDKQAMPRRDSSAPLTRTLCLLICPVAGSGFERGCL